MRQPEPFVVIRKGQDVSRRDAATKAPPTFSTRLAGIRLDCRSLTQVVNQGIERRAYLCIFRIASTSSQRVWAITAPHLTGRRSARQVCRAHAAVIAVNVGQDDY